MIYRNKQSNFFKVILNRFVLFVFLGLFLVLPNTAFAKIDEATLNHAIDRAGLQRMLTQRMLKSYCQIGQDQFYVKPDEKLKDALTRYEKGLSFLIGFESIDGVTEPLNKIIGIWPKYKTLIMDKATKANAPKLVKLNEKLLSFSHQIVLALQAESGKELGKIVNISGRQRMLSQRIELFYLLRDWGFDGDFYANALAKSRKEFTEGLAYLDNYPENTEKIKKLLAKADKSFNLFSHSLDEKNNAFLISLTVGQLLKYMNTATNLYSKM